MKEKLEQMSLELNAVLHVLGDLMTELDVLIEELEALEDDGK